MQARHTHTHPQPALPCCTPHLIARCRIWMCERPGCCTAGVACRYVVHGTWCGVWWCVVQGYKLCTHRIPMDSRPVWPLNWLAIFVFDYASWSEAKEGRSGLVLSGVSICSRAACVLRISLTLPLASHSIPSHHGRVSGRNPTSAEPNLASMLDLPHGLVGTYASI